MNQGIQQRRPIRSVKTSISQAILPRSGFLFLALSCLALSHLAEARLPSPTPDAGYPNQNTAERSDALFSLATGYNHTAIVAPVKETDGDPAQKFIENLPASKHLLKAPQPAKVQITPKQLTVASSIVSGWTFRGPAPIPNGQTNQTSVPVNGRVAAITIDPANANIAYVGAASGGLYRTTDGGGNWVQLMDNASAPSVGIPLSIGSVAIDPTDSTRLFVGTGEGNLSIDSFFGSGFYIITGANGASPVITGPFNAASGLDPGVPAGSDIFTGRSIVAIEVDPTNANNVYVSTSSGFGGIRATTYSVLPRRGLYRTQNALAANPAWTRLQVAGTEVNTISTSVILDPQSANNLLVAMAGQLGTDPSGIYRSINPTAATPTFTQSLALPANTSGEFNANSKLVAGHSGTVNSGATVVYATSAEDAPTSSSQGKLYKSTDAGATFTNIAAVNGFAGTQGFYDISVGCDPNNPNTVAVGGQAGFRVFERSTDGGTTWTIDPNGGPFTIAAGLHADVHAIVFAKSNGSVVYHGNDGGIFRSTDGGDNWTSLNGGGFSAVQFMGIALHPTDANFTDSGSQDNGTEFLKPDGSIFRTDFGDGGYSLIDQNAPDTTNVVQYHTYFTQTGHLIGAARNLTVPCSTETQWSFKGIYSGNVDPTVHCDGTTDTFNGIALTDNVQFYAPQALGPGTPNTWYFGTDKLYRSIDRADTATAQTAFLGDFVNDIAISPQDDNVRMLGTNGSDGFGFGSVWATTTGGTMVRIVGTGATNGPGPLNAAPVNRVAIDPNNKNIGYIAFGSFGTPATPAQHLYRVNNLDQLNTAGTVSVTAISNGLPDVPIDSIAIDPQSGSTGPAVRTSTDIYVGTDIGVYRSTDGGNSFAVYSTGLPRVPVFGLAIQNPNRIIRAATHGRGWYDNTVTASAAAPPAVLSVSSRLTHGGAGTFDVNMPLGGGGVEPRINGAPGAFTIVVRFTNSLAATQSGASVVYTPGGGGTGGVASFSTSGTDLIVQLTNVSDVQTGTLAVSNVVDANSVTQTTPVSVPLGFLVGDATANKVTNSADISQVKSVSGQSVTAANFRNDINHDGSLDSADISLAKANSGHAIP